MNVESHKAMYLITVYFHGPKTNWSGKIDKTEIVSQHMVPWLWLARVRVRWLMGDLNAGRCGYAITRGTETKAIEVGPAFNPSLGS